MLIRKLGIIVLLLLVSGCSSLRYHIHDDVVVAENQPIRHVPVKLLVEHGLSLGEAQAFVEAVSAEYTMPQAGIQLDVCDTGEIIWTRRNSVQDMFVDIVEWNTFSPDCDGLLIILNKQSLPDMIRKGIFGGAIGHCDRRWCRYIILHALDKSGLAHEVFHCFILDELHSGVGIMSPVAFKILPFVPALHDTYLSQADRQEVLRNKWRKFSMEPVL